MELVWGVQRALANRNIGRDAAGGYAATLAFVAAIVSSAYLLSCISRYHLILGQIEGWHHPISPRRAVRFHFIPLFNFYWSYKWPHEIARFVNWRLQRRRMSGALVGTGVLVGTAVAAFFEGSIGMVIILSTLAYISRCLREAFAATPVPRELYVTNELDATSILKIES